MTCEPFAFGSLFLIVSTVMILAVYFALFRMLWLESKEMKARLDKKGDTP